ncbi:MAG: K(+)-transporting ATPase subunit F [Beijerinckiaceae bacterium]
MGSDPFCRKRHSSAEPNGCSKGPKRGTGPDMTSYVLLIMVIALVIYLFYAIINPDKF